MTRVMVTSDYHSQYLDKDAFNKMLSFASEFKPNIFIINGDLVDFYSISKFDKNPKRYISIYDEIQIGKHILKTIRKTVGSACKIYWIEGNHDKRLEKYLRDHHELLNFNYFDMVQLFELSKYNITFIKGSMDYDKTEQEIGHLKISDMLITHGDNRMNGTSLSKYSGYSVSNSVRALMCNLIIGHSHRAAKIYHSTPYGDFIGLECGSLCRKMGTANWQQAFVTFEYDKKGSYNHYVIKISDL